MAFIPGTTLRGPLYKGLPTIEQHRHMTLLQSSHSLLKYNLDYILIGDTAINYAEAVALQQMIYHRHFKLHILINHMNNSFSNNIHLVWMHLRM